MEADDRIPNIWSKGIFFYQYISEGESLALSVTDMTTKNRECRGFEYFDFDKVPVNTAVLAEA